MRFYCVDKSAINKWRKMGGWKSVLTQMRILLSPHTHSFARSFPCSFLFLTLFLSL